MNNIQLVKTLIPQKHLICLVVLVVLYAWGFWYSALLLDSSRDLTKAYQIIEYHDWPALGPDIGGFFHVGPLWFYLLTVPAFFGSLKLVALFVGVLAGLKFVMAYQLGKDWVNAQFGLLWAFVL
ncbi:MAG: hypothetical protein KDI92_05950 [Xanthomonadales bacterium]|nr:hypothetical protein [Xanthomonadales bacterium]